MSSKKMAACETSRVLVLVLCCYSQILAQADFEPPNVTIQALKPKGIRILFPDIPNINIYVFQGNINNEINDYAFATGTISADITEPTDGRWLYQNDDLMLKPGDVIYYYYYYIRDLNGEIHKIDEQTFTVQDLVDPLSIDDELKVNDCQKTPTVVHDMKVCGGRIIFEDNFDSLREDLWRLEQYIPDKPEYTFVSYQHPPNASTISVEDGYLKIEPRLLQSLPPYNSESIITGKLDLTNGCTSPMSTECLMESWSASILPPIVSGRITTKSFAFKYGTVKIRAKLPQGDWLYPDILLESFYKRHGSLNNGSGVVRIAGARGNLELKEGDTEYGNKVLYGGVMLNVDCRDRLLIRQVNRKAWGDEFHMYSLRWTPDRITFYVDGEKWGTIQPAESGLQGLLPKECQLLRSGPSADSKMTPLDDLFGITLGLAAGGILEFGDNLTSDGVRKPWKNAERKAILKFWKNLITWWPTWRQPALLVDYVRVRAL